MRSVLLGLVFMAAISVAAWLVLDVFKTPSEAKYTSTNNSVRLN